MAGLPTPPFFPPLNRPSFSHPEEPRQVRRQAAGELAVSDLVKPAGPRVVVPISAVGLEDLLLV